MKTEDQVRNDAEKILGFDDGEKGVCQGTGQITTFNQLGFKGKSDKPDGWYLPADKGKVAIVLETKADSVDIAKKPCADELLKNISIVSAKYASVVGILYNGNDIRVFKNDEEVMSELSSCDHGVRPHGDFKRLLEKAKVMVEMAIEQGEDFALSTIAMGKGN